MLKLEELEPDTQVTGIEGATPVTILHVRRGTNSVDVSYERRDHTMLKRTLFREHEVELELVAETRRFPFDAAPDDFRLAAEAIRISHAHLFDPMMAVNSSDVMPLPHQITAVYEAMLPKQPLRFVLADDPGAGKTVMAGLLIKELIYRGDLERCLIVAPGSLVEQWQTELRDKFGISFELLSTSLADSTATGNVFVEKPLLIARLDQLSRKEEWHPKLLADSARWDLVIIDEAHKLAAHYKAGNDLNRTKRFELGKLVGDPDRTRNLLLMTATPHNGIEEDFQAWLTLVDADRFNGRSDARLESQDLDDVILRRVKEQLVRFDGKKLFPDREARTLRVDLTPAEMDLYDEVTDYVRYQMGRADDLSGKKKGMVGFALTILQRRLASSPHAIWKSLESRRKKLSERLEELRSPAAARARSSSSELESLLAEDPDGLDERYTAEELEVLEAQLADEATTANTIPELESEIELLRGLTRSAATIVQSGVDKKWDELRALLSVSFAERPELFRPDGSRKKMLIFTEHKATLDYLKAKISNILGEPAVLEIHGGTRREERLATQDRFRQDKDAIVLLATDAAGEGVNLQVASVMINYDLPWNPNRIEQRFGRIHRIGQEEVCRLFNLVAAKTREGEVFARLFEKLEAAKQKLDGRIFDVLGTAFDEVPLRDLLLGAIRGEDFAVATADAVSKLDSALDINHMKALLDRNALAENVFGSRLDGVRERMERAEARKLQPYYLQAFVVSALARTGGKLSPCGGVEKGRFEVRYVPSEVRMIYGQEGGRRLLLDKYERVTFERQLQRIPDRVNADLIHPSHPLMAGLLSYAEKKFAGALERGAVFLDPVAPADGPVRVLFLLEHAIRHAKVGAGPDGKAGNAVASRRMQFVELDETGKVVVVPVAPYLDYERGDATAPEIEKILAADWLKGDLGRSAEIWATDHLAIEHLAEVTELVEGRTRRTLQAVHARLTREIMRLSERIVRLDAEVTAGRQPRMQPANAARERDELKARLASRTATLEAQLALASEPPVVRGCALVVPKARMAGGAEDRSQIATFSIDAASRSRNEQLAMAAVLSAERALGNTVSDVSAEKCGWDVTSTTPAGVRRHIEVKARVEGADTVIVTANEVRQALNQKDKFLLAIVTIADGQARPARYVREPFTHDLDAGTVSTTRSLGELLKRAKSPSDV